MNGKLVEAIGVVEEVYEFFDFGGGEASAGVMPELFDEQGNAFFSAATMADGIFDGDLIGRCAVVEENLNSVGDGAFIWFEVLAGVARIFLDNHF